MERAEYYDRRRELLEGIACASLLVDSLEYLANVNVKDFTIMVIRGKPLGLCALNVMLHRMGISPNTELVNIGAWLEDNLPPRIFSLDLYSWTIGDVDRRYYWLRNKLVEYRNELKNYG